VLGSISENGQRTNGACSRYIYFSVDQAVLQVQLCIIVQSRRGRVMSIIVSAAGVPMPLPCHDMMSKRGITLVETARNATRTGDEEGEP
jgi:hypothetical protein